VDELVKKEIRGTNGGVAGFRMLDNKLCGGWEGQVEMSGQRGGNL